MQTQLLRLAAERISVYCPHTAMDGAVGGLNDWLCDILQGSQPVPRRPIQPVPPAAKAVLPPEQHRAAGYGRVLDLPHKVDLHTLLRRLNAGTTGSPYATVAVPHHLRLYDPSARAGQEQAPLIGKIAVCAGSGAGVFKDLDTDTSKSKDADVELLVTGEMSHHDALRHTQLGRVVATVFHSNSERRYLSDVLKPVLEARLRDTPYAATAEGAAARVLVSQADRDPFDIINIGPLA